MRAFLEPHRCFLEQALGCRLTDAVTLEVSVPFGQLAAADLLKDAPLDEACLGSGARLRPAVARFELPPDCSPRLYLEPSRKRGLLLCEPELAWDPHWAETPVAVWLKGLTHAAIAIDIPFRSAQYEQDVSWLLVNAREVGPLPTRLRPLVFQPRARITVIGGRDILLPNRRYDWSDVVLEPAVARLVRDDFEGFLQREAWFRRHGLPYTRAFLLYGPPGNGKTSVIRVMTLHPAVSAFSFNWSNSEVNDSHLSQMFEAAERSAPSVVILEDLDRIFGKQVVPRIRTTGRR